MQATTPRLYGVDLSHANVDVDLHQLVGAGSLTFIALKATEGQAFIDPMFRDRFQRIVEFLPGAYVLAYHYLRTDSSPGDQMRHFGDILKDAGYLDHTQTLAPAIDAERGLQGQQPTAADVTAAVNAFASLTGCWPGVYSGLDYWRTNLSTDVDPAYRWVARYASTPPSMAFDIWQDSETRIIAGQAYDHNVAYMTIEQFLARVGRAPQR